MRGILVNMQRLLGKGVAIVLLIVIGSSGVAEAGYGQSSYYGQSNYYSQTSYYGQATYTGGTYDIMVPVNAGCIAPRNSECGVTFNLDEVLDSFDSYTSIQAFFNYGNTGPGISLNADGDLDTEDPDIDSCVEEYCYSFYITPGVTYDSGWQHQGGGKYFAGRGQYNGTTDDITISGSAGGWGGCGGNQCSGRVSAVRFKVTGVAYEPTCSVWADTNPLTSGGQSTTLRWTSTNATTFYISNVGYVTANTTGSTTVAPSASTAYNGTASGDGGSIGCAYTITVNNPSAPTCSITLTPTTVVSGQEAEITWTSTGATSATIDNGIGSVPVNNHE
jgi:hypothetical protein